jgi:DNA-binding NarL/FixJ family response regulator
MKRARILLADDHALTLIGMSSVLETHHDVVGTVTDGQALLEAALALRPELIVADITMPLLNGIDAAVQIMKLLPGTKLLFLTMHDSSAYLEAALQAGATGYVLKSAALDELLDAVNAVLNGCIYVSRSLSGGHPERFTNTSRAEATLHLSKRERETLQLIAKGGAEKEVAFRLNISVKTVGFHRQNIKRKLGLRTTAQLTKYAIQQGLV